MIIIPREAIYIIWIIYPDSSNTHSMTNIFNFVKPFNKSNKLTDIINIFK